MKYLPWPISFSAIALVILLIWFLSRKRRPSFAEAEALVFQKESELAIAKAQLQKIRKFEIRCSCRHLDTEHSSPRSIGCTRCDCQLTPGEVRRALQDALHWS